MRDGGLDSVPAVGAGGALVAVVCCAGLPLLGAVLGGLTLAVLVGLTDGVLVVAVALAVALVVLRGRRRRACSPPNEHVTR